MGAAVLVNYKTESSNPWSSARALAHTIYYTRVYMHTTDYLYIIYTDILILWGKKPDVAAAADRLLIKNIGLHTVAAAEYLHRKSSYIYANERAGARALSMLFISRDGG